MRLSSYILLSIVFFFAGLSTARACPDLTGAYRCDYFSPEEDSSFRIKQVKDSNNVTTYYFTSLDGKTIFKTIVADGKEREYSGPFWPGVFRNKSYLSKVTYACTENALVGSSTMQVFNSKTGKPVSSHVDRDKYVAWIGSTRQLFQTYTYWKGYPADGQPATSICDPKEWYKD